MASFTTWLTMRWQAAWTDSARLRRWLRTSGPYYGGSALAHGMAVVALVSLTINKTIAPPRPIKPPINTLVEPEVAYFVMGTPALRAAEISAETLAMLQPPAQSQETFNDQPLFETAGGGSIIPTSVALYGGFGGFETDLNDPEGIHSTSPGGVGFGLGRSGLAGSGGQGVGFGGEGSGQRKQTEGPPNTEDTDRAIGAAINWLCRHQNDDGSWSFGGFQKHCSDPACGGEGDFQADAAATALAVLPILAAGQTHYSGGMYEKQVDQALRWLVEHQRPNGDLSAHSNDVMYSHALATLAICEAYRLTRDEQLAHAARSAVLFIEGAQNPRTGGWHHRPGDTGHTSNTVWQVLALQSARTAGIAVSPICRMRADAWFQSVSSGQQGGLLSPRPKDPFDPSLTAAGIVCRQTLGMDRQALPIVEGMTYLQSHLPNEEEIRQQLLNVFFMSLALRQQDALGLQWDQWNQQVRRSLLVGQQKSDCAAGSWSPETMTDLWSSQGGRLLSTSLAALTLSIHYQHLPLFKNPGLPVAQRTVTINSRAQAPRIK